MKEKRDRRGLLAGEWHPRRHCRLVDGAAHRCPDPHDSLMAAPWPVTYRLRTLSWGILMLHADLLYD